MPNIMKQMNLMTDSEFFECCCTVLPQSSQQFEGISLTHSLEMLHWSQFRGSRYLNLIASCSLEYLILIFKETFDTKKTFFSTAVDTTYYPVLPSSLKFSKSGICFQLISTILGRGICFFKETFANLKSFIERSYRRGT